MQSIIHRRDAFGIPTSFIAPSSHRFTLKLSTGIGRSFPVPDGARMVLINATAPVWVQYGSIPAVPTADDLSGSSAELNPAGRTLDGVSALGFLSTAACLVSLSFFG